MKLVELFSGIGSFRTALESLDVPAEAVAVSETQLYNQAGNAIVIQVLQAVFRRMLGA